MENQKQVSTGRKIWEIVNPLVFTFVCMLVCSIVVAIGPMMESIMALESEEELIRRVTQTTVLADLLFFAVIIVAKARTVVYDKFKYGHTSRHWPVYKCILAGAAAFGISIGLNYLIDLTGLQNAFTEYAEVSQAAFEGQNPFLLVLTVVIVGPIAEEIIFRWLIFGRTRFYFGSKWAIVVSAVLFGLYHMNMVQFVFCTLLGLLFAWLYDRSGNIWIPIGAHMAVNFFGIVGYLIN